MISFTPDSYPSLLVSERGVARLPQRDRFNTLVKSGQRATNSGRASINIRKYFLFSGSKFYPGRLNEGSERSIPGLD